MNTILVGNLPRSADRALLQMLFEDKVTRTAWCSTGQFCLVDLSDATYAAKVLAARETLDVALRDAAVAQSLAPLARLVPSTTENNNNGTAAEDNTTESNSTSSKKAKKSKRNTAVRDSEDQEENEGDGDDGVAGGASSPVAADGTVCEATDPTFLRFVRRVIVDSSELFIQRCSVSIADLIGCERRGEALRQKLGIASPTTERAAKGHDQAGSEASPARREKPQKRARDPSTLSEEAPSITDATTVESTPPPQSKQKHQQKESPRSEVVVKTENASLTASSPSRSKTTSKPTIVSKQSSSETPKPAAAPINTFERKLKDQCKFCGSEDHLSRHCPTR